MYMGNWQISAMTTVNMGINHSIGITNQQIIPCASPDGICTCTPLDNILSRTAIQRIIAFRTIYPIALSLAFLKLKMFINIAGMDNIIAKATHDEISSFIAGHEIGIQDFSLPGEHRLGSTAE